MKKLVEKDNKITLKYDINDIKTKINEQIKDGELISKRTVIKQDDLRKTIDDFKGWHSYNTELLKLAFTNSNNFRQEYESSNIDYDYLKTQTPHQQYKIVHNSFDKKLRILKNIFDEIETISSEVYKSEFINQTTAPKSIKRVLNPNIFIVHGHNDLIKEQVARTIQQLGLKPVILHEQANRGSFIFEKFERNSDVGFVVVLFTADDVGKSNNEIDYKQRARQNVVLELGYFMGKLGRNKVMLLYEQGIELPSDINGVVYEPVDSSNSWKLKLVKELRAVGYKVDANKI